MILTPPTRPTNLRLAVRVFGAFEAHRFPDLDATSVYDCASCNGQAISGAKIVWMATQAAMAFGQAMTDHVVVGRAAHSPADRSSYAFPYRKASPGTRYGERG